MAAPQAVGLLVAKGTPYMRLALGLIVKAITA
jgi:hypothetical protein